jgi:PAP_fibrillin
LTERRGDGTIFGWNILGVSVIGKEAQEDPNQPDRRIRFVFDEGNFEWKGSGKKIPYPVPFRLPILRDAVKGWIDITYLSDNLRISRGNKGTTFILQKEKQ